MTLLLGIVRSVGARWAWSCGAVLEEECPRAVSAEDLHR